MITSACVFFSLWEANLNSLPLWNKLSKVSGAFIKYFILDLPCQNPTMTSGDMYQESPKVNEGEPMGVLWMLSRCIHVHPNEGMWLNIILLN